MRSGNGRRYYTSVWKIKIIIVRPIIRYNGWGINLFIFNFTMMFIQPLDEVSSVISGNNYWLQGNACHQLVCLGVEESTPLQILLQ